MENVAENLGQGLSCNFFFSFFFAEDCIQKPKKYLCVKNQEMQAFQWFREISWLVGWI
jgi:hypothetical protein